MEGETLSTKRPPEWQDKGDYKEPDPSTDNIRVPRLEVDDATTYIDKDGSNNMTLTDAVTGTKTLAQLSAAGTGDVTGPSSSTDNAIARFNGATGKIIQDYTSNPPTVSDTGDMTVDGDLTADNIVTAGNVDGRDVSSDGTKLDGIAAGANLYVHPNHSGEVTSVADGAQTIANDAVTYAKMQNVSATDKVLGRATAGAGDVEEITCTAAGRALLDDADAAAQKTTLGLENVENTAHSTDAHTMTIDGRDVSADGTKLDGIEASADVTDATNVAAAGALMVNTAMTENDAIVLDAALSADGKYSGIVETGTAGATLAFGDLVYYAVADSRWELTDASAAATAIGKIGICVLAAAGDGSATTVLLYGKVRADTAFPTLTVGAPVHISETAGDIVVAAPSTASAIVRIIGYGNTGDELFFCPDNAYVTITA